jgi:hypothetical protein
MGARRGAPQEGRNRLLRRDLARGLWLLTPLLTPALCLATHHRRARPPGGSSIPSLAAAGRAGGAPGSAARDLRLGFGGGEGDSPNLPIFGRTPRSESLPASGVSGLPAAPGSGTSSGVCGAGGGRESSCGPGGAPGASPTLGEARGKGTGRGPAVCLLRTRAQMQPPLWATERHH